MSYLKSVLKYILTFILTLVILTLFLTATALLPRDAIRANMQESAEYLCNYPRNYYVIPSISSTQRHFYADCITLNIAWNFKEDAPLQSAMESKYYTSQDDVNKSLRASVTHDLPGEKQYLRYWHWHSS